MWRRPKVQYSDGGHTVVLKAPGAAVSLASLWRRFRFWFVNALLLALIAGIFIYGLWARADIWKFYPSTCLGNWENVDHALSRPDLDEGSSYVEFSAENSARLTGSGSQIFCANFTSDGDLDFQNNRITQARLTLSLAYVPPAPASPVDDAVEELKKTLEGEASTSAETSEETALPSVDQNASATAPASASGTSPEISAPAEPAPVPSSTPPVPPPAETSTEPAPAALESAWRRFFPMVFAQATSTFEVPPPPTETSTTTSPTSTLEIPFDPSSAEDIISSEPPTEQILIDLLEVSYSTDGTTWNLVSDIVAKDAERVTFTLPVSSWDEVGKLQIGVKGLLAGEEVPLIFLDGMELEVIPEPLAAEETAPTESETNEVPPVVETEPAPTSSAPQAGTDIEFDPVAVHSCLAEPFTVDLAPGGTARVALRFSPSPELASSSPGIRLGSPPAGVDTKLEYEAGEFFIHITASRRVLPGSYNVSVIYWQEGQQPPSYTFCQYNMVLK